MRVPIDGMRGASILALLVVALGGPHSAQDASPGLDPAEALKTFRLADDFQIELFAAEPLVADPVAMEVDEHGRLYVVEMPGYPLDVSGSGRVVVLEDADGNGMPDRRTIFAEGLRLPTGVMRWKNGVIVTDSPEVWYFEDSNGDGRADVKRLMLTGFALSNPQHTTNTPLYGLDNWIYLANEGPVRTIRYGGVFGDEGSAVHFAERPDGPRLPPDADGRNVRFRPDTFELEMLSSRSQFGQTFDAYGRHFLNTNNRHLFHEVIAARYLARNSSLLVSTAVEHVPDYRLPAEVFPITKNPKFELLTDVGVMTSACGVTLYLADLFPPAYRGAAFVAEGTHNLVHVASVRDHGVTFRASRMHEGREFLASTDPWFRPVNFYLGPDGALYVLDYYRRIFEHPEWLDDATAKSNELYAGMDRGRIYRIVPRGAAAAPWLGAINLGKAPVADLVAALANPNVWWRRHAQRLLVDRKDPEAVPLLVRSATTGSSAVARVHALHVLDGMGRLADAVLERALRDAAAGVRENAVKLAEARVGSTPPLGRALLAMHDDPDPKVRLQLLLTLGDIDSPDARTLRTRLLLDHVEDEWMQVAALSALRLDVGNLLRVAIGRLAERETPARRSLFTRIGAAIASSGEAPAIRDVLRAASATSDGWMHGAVLDGLADGLRGDLRHAAEFEPERASLAGQVLSASDGVRRATLRVLERLGLPSHGLDTTLRHEALRLARDGSADAEARAGAVQLLRLADAAAHVAVFRELLSKAEPPIVQIAAVRAFAHAAGDRSAPAFIALWHRWTPAVRDEAVRLLVTEPARVRHLLDAVASGSIRPTEIDRPLRIRLMMQPDTELRGRARALFGGSAEAEAAAVRRYAAAASTSGDRERGRRVFERACAMCHQYRGSAGAAYGPDLGEVRNRVPTALLTDILHPNASIADGFELWLVQLADGSTLTGVIGGETASALTLRLPAGLQRTVARSQIASLRVADVSAMPEGLDAQIDLEQMADLIAFIKGG